MKDVTAIASIPSAAHSATKAIHRSLDKLEKDANVIARGTSVESKDVIGALIDSRQQLLYTQAAAKLIQASDEIQKSLLDIRA